MTARAPLRTLPVVLVGVLLALAGAACSSDDDAKPVDQATTVAPEASDDDPVEASEDVGTETGSLDLSLSESVEISEVTCSNSGLTDDGVDESLAGDVECSESHDTETVSITGADDLDDCYRAIASMSDLVIVLDEDDDLKIDDERIVGHSFGGYDGEYDCTISLDEARAEPLLDR